MTKKQEIGGAAEAAFLQRIHEAVRHHRYRSDEAADQAKSASNAAGDYLESKAPEADFLVITSVPFSDGPGGFGNSIAQNIRGGRGFGISMRADVLPQLCRFFCDKGWTGFKQRLHLCWKILFGKAPEGFTRKDASR